MPTNQYAHHNYAFDGADYLVVMGSSWFISYMYYDLIDRKHQNWRRVRTYPNRSAVYRRTQEFHQTYLHEILKMDPNLLNRNAIGILGNDVIAMAKMIKEHKGW